MVREIRDVLAIFLRQVSFPSALPMIETTTESKPMSLQEDRIPVLSAVFDELPKGTVKFWVAFFAIFISSSLIPVLPIYMHQGVLMWFVPIWAIYLFFWLAPVLAVPIVVLHFTICFYIAKFAFPYGSHTRSLSLLSMFVLVSVFCVFVAMTSRFHDIGFVGTFLVFAFMFSSANLVTELKFCGVLYPRMSRRVATWIFWLSVVLAVYGMTLLHHQLV